MKNNYLSPRAGCKDIFNAHMVKNAIFDIYDIPFCPSSNIIPTSLISYSEAKRIHKYYLKQNLPDYHINAFIHTYIDDQYFDSKNNSIWLNPYDALKIICHYDGIITPDFSTYLDFPLPLKLLNTYKMRSFGLFCFENNIKVINNVRWGYKDSYDYSFSGLPSNSILSIGTVASGLNHNENKKIFNDGFNELIKRKRPHTIIIFGSDNCGAIRNARNNGIKIIQFDSNKAAYFKRKKALHEQTE